MQDFVARVQKLRRIVIPSAICELEDLFDGDLVKITIEKQRKP